MEKVEDDVMTHKPKPKNEGIFAHGFGLRIILQGLMFGALALVAFVVCGTVNGGLNTEEGLTCGQTLAFMTLATSQILHAYNMRSEKSLFKIGPFSNGKLNWACLGALAAMAIVLFIPPIQLAFGLTFLTWEMYLLGIGLSIFPIIVMEIAKACGLIKHHSHKKEKKSKKTK